MFNKFLIKFESQLNYEQIKEVYSILEKEASKLIIIPHITFIRFKGNKGEYIIRIDFDKVNCITC